MQLVLPTDMKTLRHGVQTTPPGTPRAQESQALVLEPSLHNCGHSESTWRPGFCHNPYRGLRLWSACLLYTH